MCFFPTTFVWNIPFLEVSDISKTYIGIHVMYPLQLLYFNKTQISLTDFRKIINSRDHENYGGFDVIVPKF
jgi:hypothetical protein